MTTEAGHEIRFAVNGEEYAVLSSGIVKVLNFTTSSNNENRTFHGWYVDRECTKPFSATAFTGRHNNALWEVERFHCHHHHCHAFLLLKHRAGVLHGGDRVLRKEHWDR